MAASRETGLDVLADTTPFREGLGQMAGILPPWVAEDGPEAAAAKLRDPALRERMRNESDRYWRFIHKGEWERVYFQATPAAPRARRAELPPDLGAARQGPVGLLPRHPRRRRHRLRVDPHGRDALHRRAPGGDDRPPALLPRRRHVHRPGHGAAERDHEAPARLRRPRPLPHPPRARAGHAAPGGGDPEDDEHAGRALRPLGSRPAAGGLQRRRRRLRLGRARRRLDARESHRVRTRDRARPRQRRPRRRRRRAHGRAAGPSPAARR